MSFHVLMDGVEIHSYTDPSLVLIDPTVDLEMSAAGSFEFKMPPGHSKASAINLMTSTIDVYEDNDVIFTGRPVSIETDYYNQHKVYCEGALSYLNDSVQRISDSYSVPIHTFFRSLITAHNSQVSSNRRFTVGNITVADTVVDRELNYETTYDAIRRYCLDTNGGYLFVRKENGVNYIDWLASVSGSNSQGVGFGVNLLDLSTKIDVSELATCLIPLGASVTSDEDYGVSYPLTVQSVIGSDTIETDGVSVYGRITKVQNFSEIEDPLDLYNRGLKWLQDEQFDEMEIECTAAELHFLDSEQPQLKIGQNVRCYSEPHFLDKTIPIQKISVNLNTAEKKITLGTLKKQKLTELYSQYPTADEVQNINYTVQDSKERIVKVETDISDGFTVSVSEPGGDGYVSVNIGIGNAVRTGRVRVVGNVDISGELSAEALYAAHGDIADLTVDQLCTSRRIVRWLASDTSDDNYIRIKDEAINFMSGTYNGNETQATDPYGRLIYWDSLVAINHETISDGTVTLGTDGYPRVNGERVFTTTTPTTHEENGETVYDMSPVMVYTYNENNKGYFRYETLTAEDGSTVYAPEIRLGAGNGAGEGEGNNYVTIKKDNRGFSAYLITNSGKKVGIYASAVTGNLTLYGMTSDGRTWYGTQEAYQAIVDAGEVDPDIMYYIEDDTSDGGDGE